MKAEKITTFGYAIVDGFGNLDIATVRDSEQGSIEAWVRRKAEIQGSISTQALNAIWGGYAQQWGAQVIPIEIASEGDVVLKPPAFQRLEDLKVGDLEAGEL